MVERRLGRGIEFFLSGGDVAGPKASGEEVSNVELSRLRPNPHQPRTNFDETELDQLAASIRASGVLQPILARPAGDGYEIIAGERRWRAAKLAGIERIPVLVRDIPDETAAVLALVENVQRTDLNPIEKARAFQQIRDLTQATQADVARQVGLDRSSVANLLRLLELPEEVQQHVSRGTLSMGHARALLALVGAEEQITVAEEIVRKRLSVRQVEEFVQSLNAATEPPAAGGATRVSAPKGRPVWLEEIETTLAAALGATVAIRYATKRSRISIECQGREEFERVYELLKSLAAGQD